VLGDRDDVRACYFGDCYASICLVRGIEVDVVGANACSDGKLELLCLCEALCGEVAGVESVEERRVLASWARRNDRWDVRCSDNDLSVYELLVELGVLAFLVRCCYEGVALIFKPFADTQLVLRRAYSIRVRKAFVPRDIMSISYLATLGRLWHAGHL
jgi:hypothetical protein